MRPTKRLLLVEDEQHYANKLQKELGEDFEVQFASVQRTEDRENCEILIQNGRVDFIILDIGLGDTNGRALYESLIKARYPRFKTAIWTTLTMHNKAVRWFEEQGVPVFFKRDRDSLEELKILLREYTCKDKHDIRALIVDDTPENRVFYRNSLEKNGITGTNIQEADSTAKAGNLAEAAGDPFDIFVVDIFFYEDFGIVKRGPKFADWLHEKLGDQAEIFLVTTVDPQPMGEVSAGGIRKVDLSTLNRPDQFKYELENILRVPFYGKRQKQTSSLST
jgi:DNA-binding NarL/FixJ family response regulator